jgi:hypothetical protein
MFAQRNAVHSQADQLDVPGVVELSGAELVETNGGAAPVVIFVGIKASTVYKSMIGAFGAGFLAGRARK